VVTFKRRISKNGTVYCISIPIDVANELGIEKGSLVFVEIKMPSSKGEVVLLRDVKNVSAIGKQPIIVLPKKRSLDKVWSFLYEKGVELIVTIEKMDDVLERIPNIEIEI